MLGKGAKTYESFGKFEFLLMYNRRLVGSSKENIIFRILGNLNKI